MKRVSAILIVAFLVGLWAAPRITSASAGVNDAADFFTAAGEQKAMAAIAEIFTRRHGEELLIETRDAVPSDMTYEQFADQQTKAGRVRGVYILIVRKGGHVHVAASTDTAQLFTRPVRDQLALQIVIQIQAGTKAGARHFDDVLLHAVNSVAETFEDGENLSRQSARPEASPPVPPSAPEQSSASDSGSGWYGWLLILALPGIGAWVVIALLRAVRRRRTMNRSTQFSGDPKSGGSGGQRYDEGWGPSILGGHLGAGLGSPLDNPLNPSTKSYTAHPSTEDSGSVPSWAGPSDTSQGYESSDATAGSDFGGGSDSGSGGGDFGGGGDAGGGG